MLLAIDIGNTAIKSALFEDNNILQFNRYNKLEELFDSTFSKVIDEVAFTSVVPAKSKLVSAFFKEKMNISAYQIKSNSNFNLQIKYNSIETLGIDRICSAEGAFYLYNNSDTHPTFKDGSFIISVDCGTATTVNIIMYPNIFIGGMIAPGIDTMLKSLHKNTAQLPMIENDELSWDIGSDTNSSIVSGVVNSVVGLIERTHKILKENYDAKYITTYLTGGNLNVLSDFLSIEHQIEKALVLIGVKEIYKMNLNVISKV